MKAVKRILTSEQEQVLGVFPTSFERAEIRRINREEIIADVEDEDESDFEFDEDQYELCADPECNNIWCDGFQCKCEPMSEEAWLELYGEKEEDTEEDDNICRLSAHIKLDREDEEDDVG